MEKEIHLVQKKDQETAKSFLAEIYANDRIPAEKKDFLTELKDSAGPYIAVRGGVSIMDAASQIATHALGHNAKPLYGVTQWLESWLNRADTRRFRDFKKAQRRFFGRVLGWDAYAHYCNSGSEANEIALGECFKRRRYLSQKHVLAFQSSFHGRTLVSLSATWNPPKREPFEWPSVPAVFIELPGMKTDYQNQPSVPQGWRALWADGSRLDFEARLPGLQLEDELVKKEVEVLKEIRTQLLERKIFAILIEPMQCEGGDVYTSFRFHQGLINLARSFCVPLIYDEVQTGYGLGGTFFWHQLFDLKDEKGNRLAPDFVVCAKKAQLGIVLSHSRNRTEESFATHSFIRGAIQAQVIEQNQDVIFYIEKCVRKEIDEFVSEFSDEIHSPRVQGLAFSIDFVREELVNEMINQRFEGGLMYYPAGTNTIRFRMNLSFSQREIEILFERLKKIMLLATKGQAIERRTVSFRKDPNAFDNPYFIGYLSQKLEFLRGKKLSASKAIASLQGRLEKLWPGEKYKLVRLDENSFEDWVVEIEKIQNELYEPTRRSDRDKFERCLKNGLALAVFHQKKLVGYTFAGLLGDFPEEKGTHNDPRRGDERVLYSMDLSVVKSAHGKELGSFLKYALCMVALSEGFEWIRGRNRNRYASKMYALNYSLGGYEIKYLDEDYQDDLEFRGCHYYTIPLRFQQPPLTLCQGIASQPSLDWLNDAFTSRLLGPMVNKMCLSNFVSESFMTNLRDFSDQLPETMRHCYTASGQSECLDKVVKTIWNKRKIERVLTFKGCFFGHGTFMSRALSQKGNPFFQCDVLEFPKKKNWKKVIESVKTSLSENPVLAIFVEPLTQHKLKRMPVEFLKALRELCNEYDTPLVSNDTAGILYRYDVDAFCPSELFSPDVAMAFLGGQIAMAYCKPDYYISKPLTLISTWDGDEVSLALFCEAMRRIDANKAKVVQSRREFTELLVSVLKQHNVSKIDISMGFGYFKGEVTRSLAALFRHEGGGHYSVCPSDGEIMRFLEEGFE